MAVTDIEKFLGLIPAVKESPQRVLWLSYDQEADTLPRHGQRPHRR